MSHTPTPFTKNPKNGRIIMAGSAKIATCNARGPQSWKDAEFIILACNAHDGLLAACKMGLAALADPSKEQTPAEIAMRAAIAAAEPA